MSRSQNNGCAPVVGPLPRSDFHIHHETRKLVCQANECGPVQRRSFPFILRRARIDCAANRPCLCRADYEDGSIYSDRGSARCRFRKKTSKQQKLIFFSLTFLLYCFHVMTLRFKVGQSIMLWFYNFCCNQNRFQLASSPAIVFFITISVFLLLFSMTVPGVVWTFLLSSCLRLWRTNFITNIWLK